MKKITSKEFWENRQKKEATDIKLKFITYKHPSDKIIKKYLTRDPNKSFLEIGCVPGQNMVYFAKEFGYRPSGVDYSKYIDNVYEKLASQGIKDFNLYKEDFFAFDSLLQFDVVLSSGFVEHFDFDYIEEVFTKHVNLLADNGVLIIDMPNFRYGQRLLRNLLRIDPQKEHNIDVMWPDLWRSLSKKHNLSILYCNYYRTFAFWLPADFNFVVRTIVRIINKIANITLDTLGLGNIPNRWFSPYILLVAKK